MVLGDRWRHPTVFPNARPLQQIVMAVTNAHPGRVRIVGMDLSYSHGWQRGTQRTGPTVVVGSRSPAS